MTVSRWIGTRTYTGTGYREWCCQMSQLYMFPFLSHMLNLTIYTHIYIYGVIMAKWNKLVHYKLPFNPICMIARIWWHQPNCLLVAKHTPVCHIVTSQLLLLQLCDVMHRQHAAISLVEKLKLLPNINVRIAYVLFQYFTHATVAWWCIKTT